MIRRTRAVFRRTASISPCRTEPVQSSDRMQQGFDVGVAFSVVIPAFNEAARLPQFLPGVVDYLENEFPNAFEVIVVDDGSTDATSAWLSEQQTRSACLQ